MWGHWWKKLLKHLLIWYLLLSSTGTNTLHTHTHATHTPTHAHLSFVLLSQAQIGLCVCGCMYVCVRGGSSCFSKGGGVHDTNDDHRPRAAMRRADFFFAYFDVLCVWCPSRVACEPMCVFAYACVSEPRSVRADFFLLFWCPSRVAASRFFLLFWCPSRVAASRFFLHYCPDNPAA